MIVFGGRGWLTYVVMLPAFALSGLLVNTLHVPGDHVVWIGLSWAVVGGALQWTLGRALNSTRSPDGRIWHDTHTTAGQPMQDCTGVHVFLGLTIVAIRTGQLTSPLVGWLLFAAAIAVSLFVGSWAANGEVPRFRRDATVRRATGDTVRSRRALAKANGWRFRGSWSGPVKSWEQRHGPAMTLLTSDVVTGERRGLAFTIFDLMAAPGVAPLRLHRTRRTVIRVALNTTGPVPRSMVAPAGTLVDFHGTPPWEPVYGSTISGLQVVSDNKALAERYLTRQVLNATAAAGLSGWRVEDGALVYATQQGKVLDPREALTMLTKLVDLAQLVPQTPDPAPPSRPAGPSTTPPRPAAVPRQRTGTETPAPATRPAGPRVITTRHIRLTLDLERLVVHRRAVRATAGWQDHLAVEWRRVRSLLFDTQGLDPVVALFALLDEGPRKYVADANHLSRPEWSTFAAVVAEYTGGRLTIDLDRRDDPRSLRDS